MSSRAISDLAPEMQVKAKAFLSKCAEKNLNVIVICTYRSSDEQNKLYAQGREYEGKIVTNAKGGESPHNTTKPAGSPASLAFDFCPLWAGKCVWDAGDPLWERCIAIARGLGLESGADWKMKDMPHLQMPLWKVYCKKHGFFTGI